jgi:hypothetical protein
MYDFELTDALYDFRQYEQALTQRETLEAFYDATNGDSWFDNSGWKTEQFINNWFGVTAASGTVLSLVLRDNDLSGTRTLVSGLLCGVVRCI